MLFQVCNNIKQVRFCMEAGQTVVLLNMENMYESLYEAMNQVSFFFFIVAVFNEVPVGWALNTNS